MSGSYPWYTSDWRTCLQVLNMTAEQRGVYRDLLDVCWEWGDLPTDLGELQRLSLATPAEFERTWPAIRLMFAEFDGRLHNRKVDERRPFVLTQKEKRADKGRLAARARWDEARAKNAPSMENYAPCIQPEHAPSMNSDAPSTENHARHPSPVTRHPSPVTRQTSQAHASSSSSPSSTPARETTTMHVLAAEQHEQEHPAHADAESLAAIREACVRVARHAGSRIAGSPGDPVCQQIYEAFGGDRERIQRFFKGKYENKQGPERSWAWFVTCAREEANTQQPPAPAAPEAEPAPSDLERMRDVLQRHRLPSKGRPSRWYAAAVLRECSPEEADAFLEGERGDLGLIGVVNTIRIKQGRPLRNT
ncbi:MAG: DUF1376 domain-containing protein [Bryobacteraceae bacterium]